MSPHPAGAQVTDFPNTILPRRKDVPSRTSPCSSPVLDTNSGESSEKEIEANANWPSAAAVARLSKEFDRMLKEEAATESPTAGSSAFTCCESAGSERFFEQMESRLFTSSAIGLFFATCLTLQAVVVQLLALATPVLISALVFAFLLCLLKKRPIKTTTTVGCLLAGTFLAAFCLLVFVVWTRDSILLASQRPARPADGVGLAFSVNRRNHFQAAENRQGFLSPTEPLVTPATTIPTATIATTIFVPKIESSVPKIDSSVPKIAPSVPASADSSVPRIPSIREIRPVSVIEGVGPSVKVFEAEILPDREPQLWGCLPSQRPTGRRENPDRTNSIQISDLPLLCVMGHVLLGLLSSCCVVSGSIVMLISTWIVLWEWKERRRRVAELRRSVLPSQLQGNTTTPLTIRASSSSSGRSALRNVVKPTPSKLSLQATFFPAPSIE